MSHYFVWNPLNRSFLRPYGLSRKGFHHFARSFGIGDPFRVELIRARRDAAVAFARIDHPGIAAMHQLEEMIFGLSGPACIADQHLRKLSVLNSVFFFAALTERATIKANDRRVAEIGVDAIESSCIG